ncbi:hypothetical protein ACQ4PT_069882 [Festuca glaucescens]
MERLRIPPVPILGGRSVNPLAFIACHVATAIPQILVSYHLLVKMPTCTLTSTLPEFFCMLLLLINPLTRRMVPFLRHYRVFGTHRPLLQTAGRNQNLNGGWSAQCVANGSGTSVSDGNGARKDSALPDSLLRDARVLYCASPAMGHNKESHPESNKRVPAIVDALEKLELTPKHRGSQVLEIQNFYPASLDDVARVHSRTYITGLEKAMSRASDEGLIFIEGTGPTYATHTTFQESLLSAGAGITLVDSVCSFPENVVCFPRLQHQSWAQAHPLDLH